MEDNAARLRHCALRRPEDVQAQTRVEATGSSRLDLRGGDGAGRELAIVTDVAYLVLIRSKDATPPNPGVIPFLVVYIAAVAVAGALSAWLVLGEHGTAAKILLVATAAGSAGLGFIAIFSIGLGMLVAAGFFAAAAAGVATTAGRTPQVLGALSAIGLLVAGFTVTGVFWGS